MQFEEFVLDEKGKKQLKILESMLVSVPNPTISTRIKGLVKHSSFLSARLKSKPNELSMQAHYEKIWSKKSLEAEFSSGPPICRMVESRKVMLGGKEYYSPDRWLTAVMIVCIASKLRAVSSESVIEVGSGSGMLSLALAATFPNKSFIGLELTQSGISSSLAAMHNQTVVYDVCKFVFGEEIKESIVFPVENLTFRKLDLSDPIPDISAPFVYSSLAFEQMETVFDKAFLNTLEMATEEMFFLEPFLEFNSKRQKSVLSQKKYLYRSILKQNLGNGNTMRLFDLPQKINKKKYAFGIVNISKP